MKETLHAAIHILYVGLRLDGSNFKIDYDICILNKKYQTLNFERCRSTFTKMRAFTGL